MLINLMKAQHCQQCKKNALPLKTGPKLVSQSHQKFRLCVKTEHRQQYSHSQGVHPVFAQSVHAISGRVQAAIVAGFIAGARTIGASLTGQLIKAPKIPSAMQMYQTML